MSGLSVDKSKVRKFIPVLFLAALTIALMFYFKENKGDFGEVIQKGKDDLLSLYTENLEPLLFGTDITNEDVFNFALYQTLPIDKNEKRVLKISQSDGNTNYEVIPDSYISGTNNYDSFIKYMQFTENQKTQLDSILESYQSELAEAVFTDSKQTYAVNARLGSLQKAVLTDVAAFARNANKPKLSSLFGNDVAFVDSKNAKSLIDEIKRDTSNEYLIISEDTAFTSRLEFNTAELTKKLESIKNNNANLSEFRVKAKNNPNPVVVKPKPPKLNDIEKSGYNFSYTLPNFNLSELAFNKSAMDSLELALNILEKELNNISFSFDADSVNKSMKYNFQKLNDDSLHSLKLEFNFENLGEIINKSIEGAMSGKKSAEYWEDFGMQMDSLAQEMVKAQEDSLGISKEMLQKLENLKNKKKK